MLTPSQNIQLDEINKNGNISPLVPALKLKLPAKKTHWLNDLAQFSCWRNSWYWYAGWSWRLTSRCRILNVSLKSFKILSAVSTTQWSRNLSSFLQYRRNDRCLYQWVHLRRLMHQHIWLKLSKLNKSFLYFSINLYDSRCLGRIRYLVWFEVFQPFMFLITICDMFFFYFEL